MEPRDGPYQRKERGREHGDGWQSYLNRLSEKKMIVYFVYYAFFCTIAMPYQWESLALRTDATHKNERRRRPSLLSLKTYHMIWSGNGGMSEKAATKTAAKVIVGRRRERMFEMHARD